jgi:hypothetical protein
MPGELHRIIGAAALDNEFREDLFKSPKTIDKRYAVKISEKTRQKLVTLTKSAKLKQLLEEAEQILCTNAGTEPMDCFLNRITKRKKK